MSESEASPAESPVMQLAIQLRRLLWCMRRKLSEQGDFGEFSSTQVMALIHLERRPWTVTELADKHGIRPQSMGATIASLEEAGMVVGNPDPNDGRKTIWSLTEESRARVVANHAAKYDWLAGKITAELNAAEQRKLAEALDILDRIAGS